MMLYPPPASFCPVSIISIFENSNSHKLTKKPIVSLSVMSEAPDSRSNLKLGNPLTKFGTWIKLSPDDVLMLLSN